MEKQVFNADIALSGVPLNYCVRHGNMIFVSGLPPFTNEYANALSAARAAGKPVPPFPDIPFGEQCRIVMDNLKKLVEASMDRAMQAGNGSRMKQKQVDTAGLRLLFDDLESRREVVDLLGRAERGDGVRIFIGSENKLFSLSGSSTIIAPYHDRAGNIVGVLGVIGPTRLNYARVIPMVDYTAKVVGRLLGV